MKHPKKYTIDGVDYGLKHLWPINETLVLPESSRFPEISVPAVLFFSNHCISTEAEEGGVYDFLDHHNDPRRFCPERYKLSFGLKQELRRAVSKKCLSLGKRGWQLTDRREHNGAIMVYHIYFTIAQKHNNPDGVVIFVNSAYLREPVIQDPRRKGDFDRVDFSDIVRKTIGVE